MILLLTLLSSVPAGSEIDPDVYATALYMMNRM